MASIDEPRSGRGRSAFRIFRRSEVVLLIVGFDLLFVVAGEKRGQGPDVVLAAGVGLRGAHPCIIGQAQLLRHGDAAGGLVGPDADEDGPLVRRAHRSLGEHAPDLVRLL